MMNGKTYLGFLNQSNATICKQKQTNFLNLVCEGYAPQCLFPKIFKKRKFQEFDLNDALQGETNY